MCPEGPFLVRWGLETHYQKVQSISLLVLSSDGISEYSIYALCLSEVGVSGQPVLLQPTFLCRHTL
jgi:hypothetical protein